MTRFPLNQAQRLYQLQQLDSRLDDVQAKLAEIEAVLGESQALKKAKANVETAEKALRKVQTVMLDLELEVKSLSDKIAQQEKTLYSGAVTSAKEAANLQGEVASLKRWHTQREELLLEAMVDAEAAEDQLHETQAALATTQQEWAAGQEDLVQKQANLQTLAAELTAQRPALVTGIAEADLTIYENLRRKRAGRAVAVLKNRVCQACGITAPNNQVQQARLGAELTYCGSCGRILYAA